MTARDTAHAYDLGHACPHLYRDADLCPVCTPRCEHLSSLDRIDGLTCLCDPPNRTSDDSDRHGPSPQMSRPRFALAGGALLLAVVLGALAALALTKVAQPALCAVNGQQSHSYCPEFTADRQETQ